VLMDPMAARKGPEPGTTNDATGEVVVPLHEEAISITKRDRETGRVRVSTITREHEQLVDEALKREQVEVERIPIGKAVTEMPGVRREGETIIVPVVEEQLVIGRRLILKEEVHIKRVHRTEQHQERVVLHKQEATVTRIPSEEAVAERGSISPDRSKDRMEERK
jgi:uncharacterized protein (TIGR02271 family)